MKEGTKKQREGRNFCEFIKPFPSFAGSSCFVGLEDDKRLLKSNQEMEFVAKSSILVSNWQQTSADSFGQACGLTQTEQ